MQKLLLSVFLAAGVIGATLPAQAASVPRCETGSSSYVHFDADQAELRLRGLGLNVKTVPKVEIWNNCYRAYITNPDGSESVMYFDPTTLQQVG